MSLKFGASQVARAMIAAAGAAITLGAATAAADSQPDAAMLRYPDISATQIVFVYANDLWVAPRAGGMASPLASPPGGEMLPKFSPDGKTIAFVGNYDGNRDIYTIPATGGTAKRVSYHPGGELLSDWSSQNQLLFITSGLAGLARQNQLFSVSPEGGLPQRFAVPYGGFGTVSPNGQWLAYTPHSVDFRTWKRYRGGMATDVWLFNLKDNTSRRITDWEGTDTLPMWAPGDDSKVYYLSDNGPDHRMNIWVCDIASGNREQVTKYTDDDIHWPSMGPGPNGKGEVIFQLGSELRVLDLATRKDSVIKVTIPGDKPKVRQKGVDAARNIEGGTISPSGKRVVAQARGDLWSLPAKEGVPRNLTRTDGVFERDPSWSPDGRWIAYFSDESGEYELWIRPSDAKPKKDEAKKDEAKKDEGKKDEGKPDDAAKAGDDKAAAAQPDGAKPDADAAPRKLTNLGPGFRYNPVWSPDSKKIAFTDKTGAIMLIDVASGEIKEVDRDPWDNPSSVSWSASNDWITYGRSDEASTQSAVWVYNVKTGEKTRLTDPLFNSVNPVFDKAGDYLYFASNRTFSNPMYADLDLSFVYANTQQLFIVPLRKDVKSPWLTKSDEEEFKPAKDEKAKDDAQKDAKKDDKKEEKKDEKPAEQAAKADDGVSGTWDGKAGGSAEGMPPEGVPFKLNLRVADDGSVSGSIVSAMGAGQISSGKYDKSSGAISFTVAVGQASVAVTGSIKNGELTATWSMEGESGPFNARRESAAAGGGDVKADDKAKEKDKPKELKIDLEGFEARAMALPINSGNFGGLAVTDDNKLVFARVRTRGGDDPPAIKIFDPKDESREEKTVTAGAAEFQLSADGKKLLVFRGGSSMTVMDATAGGGKSTAVPTGGMTNIIDPKTEWKQIFTDAWRLERDFFYEPTMHGVDWPKMREHYGKMIDDCASRDDVAYVIGELISELNIGHAYVTSPGDVEGQPFVPVGMLGCDYELVHAHRGDVYRISRIYTGGPWDADARGPLSQPGVDVKVGDYLLAVNGVPVDAAKDPWAAFVGTADRATTITVSDKPQIDASAREVLIKPISTEVGLRYRAWIEEKREYVEKKSDGKIGYIYVPNTGVDGQNDLFRQFFGQRGKAALIIDDRWNGGGQIPNRFIELLNRPVTNYWARRDGKDWVWPPDSHQGPKAMLINGLAGSGGDMFPWLFKHHKIGKVIGMRTWGGLVGISGNPGLMDGGSITVPTFGFYKTDGTWGVEGHGVDPDIEVIDDPAKMLTGGDPQLDRAVEELLKDIAERGYQPPKRPASPDRRGMGIPEQDR